jgi:hypothetical protein
MFKKILIITIFNFFFQVVVLAQFGEVPEQELTEPKFGESSTLTPTLTTSPEEFGDRTKKAGSQPGDPDSPISDYSFLLLSVIGVSFLRRKK